VANFSALAEALNELPQENAFGIEAVKRQGDTRSLTTHIASLFYVN